MAEMVAINILIGDRSYRIKIDPKDEEAVRKVVKVINEKLSEFKTHFAGKDMQDYVAMVLVWYATLQTESPVDQMQNNNLEEKLLTLENMLDKMLGQ